MHVIFNLTLQPTQDWWNMPISQTNTDIPATLELAYIKVAQLKPEGSTNNLPNQGTVWGQCQDHDICVTRFQERLLYQSYPSALCDKQHILNLESTWQLPWEPEIFPCNEIEFTADPGLHATFNCSPHIATVNINADNYNQEYNFQLSIPQNAGNNCVSEAVRIIKHKLIFLKELPETSALLDNTVQIPVNSIYNGLMAGSDHIVSFVPFQEPLSPKSFWWEINGVKFSDGTSPKFKLKGGINNLILTLVNENNCITILHYYINAICPAQPPVPSFNFSLNGNSLSTNSPYNTTPATWQFVLDDNALKAEGYIYYFMLNGVKYENTNTPQLPIKKNNNEIKLHIYLSNTPENCENIFSYTVVGNCYNGSPIIFKVQLDGINKYCSTICQSPYYNISFGEHLFSVNYSIIKNSDLKLEYYYNNSQLLPISDDGTIRTYKIVVQYGFSCLNQIIYSPTEPNCKIENVYPFNINCTDLGITKIDNDFIRSFQWAAVMLGSNHTFSVDASGIPNNNPISYDWKIYRNSTGMVLLHTTDQSFSYSFVYPELHSIEYTINFQNGLKSCGSISVSAKCYEGNSTYGFAPVFSIDGNLSNYIYNPEPIKELCPGQHHIKIENLESVNGQVTFSIYKNGIFMNLLNINDVFLTVEETDVYTIYVTCSTSCGSFNGKILINGKQCGEKPPACVFQINPNPSDYNIDIISTGNVINNGTTYSPTITDIRVYDKYNIQRKYISVGNVPSYNLSIADLPNNDFYIVEIKDQYNNICRKMLLVVR